VKPLARLDGIPVHIDCHPIRPIPIRASLNIGTSISVGMPGEITLQAAEVRGWRWADVRLVPEAVREHLDLLAG
jgi:hypothetical protein